MRPQTQEGNGWLRSYVVAALPALIIALAVIALTAAYEARARTVAQLAQEMTALAGVYVLQDPAPQQSADFVQLLELSGAAESQFNLFVVGRDNGVVASVQSPEVEQLWFDQPRSIVLEGPHPGQAFGQSTWWLGNLAVTYHWQPAGAPYYFLARADDRAVLDEAFRIALPPLLAAGLITLLPGIAVALHQSRWRSEMRIVVDRARYAVDVGGIRPTDPMRDAELSQLAASIDALSTALDREREHNRLLLNLARKTATPSDIAGGMQAIVTAALDATHADGARAVLVNPNGGQPLRFGAGEAHAEMAQLDRNILLHVRREPHATVASGKSAVREALDLAQDANVAITACVAFPLYSGSDLKGALWVGYRRPLVGALPGYGLLRSIADRASQLLTNAFLFNAAEGGRRKLAAVVSNTSDAIIVTDQTNRITLVNGAFERAFGVDGRELYGRLVPDVITASYLIPVLNGNFKDVDGSEVTTPDGRTFYASVSRVAGHDGHTLGRIVALHELTPYKQVDELESEFIASVSHDLRNPLSYMHTYAMLLPDLGPLTPEQVRSIENILHGINRMRKTVGELIDLSRIESESDRLNLVPTELNSYLTMLMHENRPHASAAGVEIQLRLPGDAVTVYADQWSLRLAINNLISNALSYAPHSGEVVLSVEETTEAAVISVQDNGPGISKAEQARIFDKYYRAPQSATPDVEGSGLGLAIVKSVATRHNGRVWCESEPGKGSVFYIALPTGIPASADGSAPG